MTYESDMEKALRHAEKMRDDALLDAAALQRRLTETEARAERAEADNAAWVDFVTAVLAINAPGNIHDYARRMLANAHPGAALLEYVKALDVATRPFAEEVRVVFEAHHAPSQCSMALRLTVADGERLLDAVKERKP